MSKKSDGPSKERLERKSMMCILTHPTLTGTDTIPIFNLHFIFESYFFIFKFNIKSINSVFTLELKFPRQMEPPESKETHRTADL